MDWIWVFAICLFVGVGLAFWGTTLERDARDAGSGGFAMPSGAGESEEAVGLGTAIKWIGIALLVVGGIGLLFCGVTRSGLLGRPGY
jgi:hypothetical protein